MSHVPHSEHPMEDCSSVQPTFQTPASSRTLSSRTTKRPRRFSDSVDSPPSHQQPRPPPTSTRRKSSTPSSKKLVVEQILDQRSRAGEEDEVLIHWKGFPMDQATWEPISNTDCPNLLLSFFSSRKEAVPPSTPPILRHAIPPSTNSQAQSPRRNQHRPSPLRQRKDYLIPLPNPQRSQLLKRSHQQIPLISYSYFRPFVHPTPQSSSHTAAPTNHAVSHAQETSVHQATDPVPQISPFGSTTPYTTYQRDTIENHLLSSSSPDSIFDPLRGYSPFMSCISRAPYTNPDSECGPWTKTTGPPALSSAPLHRAVPAASLYSIDRTNDSLLLSTTSSCDTRNVHSLSDLSDGYTTE